jgi:hypothetical protein
MSGGFDNNTKVVSLRKSYARLERGERLELSSYGVMDLNMCHRCGVDRIKRYISLGTATGIT